MMMNAINRGGGITRTGKHRVETGLNYINPNKFKSMTTDNHYNNNHDLNKIVI